MAAAAAGDEHVAPGDGTRGPAVGDVGLRGGEPVLVLARDAELGPLRLASPASFGRSSHPPIATLAISRSRSSSDVGRRALQRRPHAIERAEARFERRLGDGVGRRAVAFDRADRAASRPARAERLGVAGAVEVSGEDDDVEALLAGRERPLALFEERELGRADPEVVAEQLRPAQAVGAVVDGDHAARAPVEQALGDPALAAVQVQRRGRLGDREGVEGRRPQHLAEGPEALAGARVEGGGVDRRRQLPALLPARPVELGDEPRIERRAGPAGRGQGRSARDCAGRVAGCRRLVSRSRSQVSSAAVP